MIFAYRLTLTGEAMQLPTVKPKYEMSFSTPSTNAGSVYLADSPVSAESVSFRYAIAAGKDFPLKVTNLSKLYAYGTATDVLDMICEVKEGKKNVKTDKKQ